MTEPQEDPDITQPAAAAELAFDPAGSDTKRRRKMFVLAFLAAALLALALFSGWYLLFRKPISTLPIPGIGLQNLPHYSFSIYGVKAPMGVAVSSSGDRIYVTETGAERLVHVFDQSGAEVGTFSPPRSESATRVPVYVVLDPTNGDVYVSDRPSKSIYVYDKDGRFRHRFEPATTLDPFEPLGLAFDRQGNLYVSDVSGPIHRIIEFDRTGAIIRTIGEKGQFNFPNGLAVDDLGNLFVANSNDGQVVVIDATGRQIGIIPRGMANGELGLPRGAAIDDGHRLYVADSTGQALQIYTLDEATSKPKYYGTVGTEGMADGQFEYPNGVATDTRARIYIADWANDRIQVWTY
jgi:DNA-binding beta-propeller fold protein YncE